MNNNNVNLIHGDCLEHLQDIKNVKCLLTDPPYRVTSGGKSEVGGGWLRHDYDNKGSIVDCEIDWKDWLPLIPDCLEEQAHCYIFTNDRNEAEARIEAEKAGLDFHRLLIWDKKTAFPNRWYQQTCEFVLFMKYGKAYQINNPSTKTYYEKFHRGTYGHPTEKPVELCEKYILNSTNEGDTILDPFMGTGTTGIAALRTNRKFIGIELEEKYFNIASERINKEQESNSFGLSLS